MTFYPYSGLSVPDSVFPIFLVLILIGTLNTSTTWVLMHINWHVNVRRKLEAGLRHRGLCEANILLYPTRDTPLDQVIKITRLHSTGQDISTSRDKGQKIGERIHKLRDKLKITPIGEKGASCIKL